MQLSKKRRKELVHAADEARYLKDCQLRKRASELDELEDRLMTKAMELSSSQTAVEARERAAGPIPPQDVASFAADLKADAQEGRANV